MAKSSTEKYKLSMAGEYGVCAELSKLGFDASITFGNMKATDIVVVIGTELRRIEVKTTRSTKFVTNFFQKKYFIPSQSHPDYWVLVHVDSNNNSRFFVLTHQEMGDVQMQRNGMSSWAQNQGGVDNVLLKHIVQFENQWDKIK
jgi:hypothetical protein